MTDLVGRRTLPDLLAERVAIAPSKTFIVFEDRNGLVEELTYAEFAEAVAATASGLRRLGVEHGDHVLVHLRNCPEFLMSWLALGSIGAVIVPSNVANTRAEIDFITERARVKIAIVGHEFLDSFDGYASQHGSVRSLVVARTDEHVDGTLPFSSLRSMEGDADATPSAVRDEDVSQILFTSGTTAKPKGVLITHANALWSGERIARGMAYRPEDRCMTALPLFHVNAQAVTFLGALTAGATVVLLEEFRAAKYVEQLHRHQVTQTSLVATQSRALLAEPPGALDGNLAVTDIGHAINVSDAEKVALEQRFGAGLVNIYGLSEAAEIVTLSPLRGERRWPSVGLPAMDRTIRVVADDGSLCAPGMAGELEVHGVPGRTVMAGYFDDPDATAAVMQDGWVKTGDYGYVDDAGFVYFVDRKKDLIKTSGHNVAAVEVEAVLVEHPAVVEAAVIAVPHPTRGESIKAFVVADRDLTFEDLLEFCSSRLAKFKRPEQVDFISALPRTSVGKIAKGELRAREN